MKARLTLVDILAEVRDLRAYVGMNLLNVYDVDDKTFLLALKESGSDRVMLLIESGTRIHTTRYARDKPVTPGPFAMKLRKHIRGKRLMGIEQVGLDRVIDITFGVGDGAHHLIVELYDRGNVVLTDAGYTILALLRQYTLEAEGGGGGGKPDAPEAAAAAAEGGPVAGSRPPSSGKAGGKGGGKSSGAGKPGKGAAGGQASGASPALSSGAAAAGGAADADTAQAGAAAASAVSAVSPAGSGGDAQRAGKTGRGQRAKLAAPVAATHSLALAASLAGVSIAPTGASAVHPVSADSAGALGAAPVLSSSSLGAATATAAGAAPGAAAAAGAAGGRVRVAVKQRYTFTPVGAAAAELVASWGGRSSGAGGTDPTGSSDSSGGADGGGGAESGGGADNGLEHTGSRAISITGPDGSGPSGASAPAPTPGASPVIDPTPGASPVIDLRADERTVSSRLAAYLAFFESVKLGALAPKAQRKLTLASLLATKGSGVDMFGPVLLEHAVASAFGGQGEALLSALRPSPAEEAEAADAAAAAAPPSAVEGYSLGDGEEGGAEPPSTSAVGPAAPAPRYSARAVATLARALRALPPLLRHIATVPATAVAVVEVSDPGRYAATEHPGLGGSGVVDLGQWADVQARYKRAVVAAAPASVGSAEGAASSATVEAGVVPAAAAAPSTGAPTTAVDPATPAGPSDPPDDAAASSAVPAGSSQSPPDVPFTFLDFAPCLLAQYGNPTIGSSSGGSVPTVAAPASTAAPPLLIRFPTFDSLVDEYFSRLDLQRAARNEASAQAAAGKRLDRIRAGHAEALEALGAAEAEAAAKGRAIEHSPSVVEAASLVVRSALEHGVQWLELEALVAAEAGGGNPVARLIRRMDLGKGSIVMALRDEGAAEEAAVAAEEAGTDGASALPVTPAAGDPGASKRRAGPVGAGHGGKRAAAAAAAAAASAAEAPFTLLIDIDVFESAAANARRYYTKAKAAREKRARAVAAADIALKKAEKTAEESAAKQVAAAAAVRSIALTRSKGWYEKFAWFISSEGILVVAGKSAGDNEALVKRYLRPQDMYVHADVHGAATVVVRHPSNSPTAGVTDPLPPLTLQQAGAFCVCLSSAWAAHVGSAAWYATAAQVSKTAPTGEYLGTGSFMVRGKKTFLPPTKLELGMVLLWRVEEGCVDRHLGDRRVRGAGAGGAGTEGHGNSGGSGGGSVGALVERTRGGLAAPLEDANGGKGGGAGADASRAAAAAADVADTAAAAAADAAAATVGADADESSATAPLVRARDTPLGISAANATPTSVAVLEGHSGADAAAAADGNHAPPPAIDTAPADANNPLTADISEEPPTPGPLTPAPPAPGAPALSGGSSGGYSGGSIGGASISAYTRRLAKKLAKEGGLDPATALKRALQQQQAAAAVGSSSASLPGAPASAAPAASKLPGAAQAGVGEGHSALSLPPVPGPEGEPDGEGEEEGPPPPPTATAAAAAAPLPVARGSGSSSSPAPLPPPPSKRGQAGRARKAKTRYADQDEEDRALAAAAVGHAFHGQPQTRGPQALPGASTAGKQAAAAAAGVGVGTAGARGTGKGAGTAGKKGSVPGGSGSGTPNGGGETAKGSGVPPATAAGRTGATSDADVPTAAAAGAPAAGAGKPPRPRRTPLAPAAAAPGDGAAAGGDDPEDGAGAGASSAPSDASVDEARQLASLVTVPLPDDILLHVVPMLCPYSVCLSAKYAVKLTPGTLKKGKAAAGALHLWGTAAKGLGGTARERELLRGLAENEVVGTVLGNVKVAAAATATGLGAGGGSAGQGRGGKGQG